MGYFVQRVMIYAKTKHSEVLLKSYRSPKKEKGEKNVSSTISYDLGKPIWRYFNSQHPKLEGGAKDLFLKMQKETEATIYPFPSQIKEIKKLPVKSE